MPTDMAVPKSAAALTVARYVLPNTHQSPSTPRWYLRTSSFVMVVILLALGCGTSARKRSKKHISDSTKPILVHTLQKIQDFPMDGWDLLVHPATVDTGVSASIANSGFCCRGTSHFLRHSVRTLQEQRVKSPSKSRLVALDIGANIGYHTIELGKLGCRVVAWELLPLNFNILRRNVELNALSDSVDLVPRGASDQSRSTAVRMHEHSPGMTTIGNGGLPWRMEDVKGEELKVSPGSVELERLGIERVDIIKIDVEGHEIEALRGFGSLRKLGVKRLHTEFFPAMIEANGHAAVDYLHYLYEQGLDCFSRFSHELDHRALLKPEMFEVFTDHKKATQKHTDLYCIMRNE